MGRSSYPGQLDSDVELPYVDDNISEIGGDAINSLRDAIMSIEEAIGIMPQGNLSDFVTRINRVIDHNGYIKTSALAEKGLVTLPISDTHIAYDAGIKESKLDLDYPTATLYARYDSNLTDIDAIRTSLSAFASRTISHFGGLGDRHDGYHIDLTTPIRSSDDLETAINVLNNAFTDHEGGDASAHAASSIRVNNEFQNFSAINVQDSLIELDRLGAGEVERHQDQLHTNAVSLNDQGEQGDQGNLKETVLASTIFQTETSKATNILQVMRPNVARVTSKNMDLRAVRAGESHILRIQAGGVNRDPLDVNLTAIIPIEDVDTLVAAINITAQGCEYHYPISAYNTGGKLTIAHNIPGDEFTIQILSNNDFQAASALGFGDVVSTVFTWSGESHAGYAGGYRIKDLKPLIKVHYNHTGRPLSLISPGLGDLSEYGLTVGDEGRVLCNITNHSTTPEDNGTHYILAYPNSESFSISADIQNGEFDLEVVGDAVNFRNSANGELYDIFVEHDDDGYGIVTKSNRISYGPIGGVSLRTVSKDFPTENVEWEVSGSNSIRIYENGSDGVPTTIPTGFQGPLEVFCYDNKNSAIFEVHGAPSNRRRDLDVAEFSGTNDRLYVSSVHYSGNFGLYTLKYVMDKRQLGGSPESKSEDVLSPVPLQNALKDLRNNGVLRGLDIISSDSSSIRVRGGKVLVDGNVIDIETQDIVVNEFGAASRLLLVDNSGSFIIKSEYDSGFAFADLISGDAYGDTRSVAIIAEFETNGSAIDGYLLDRRLMLNNIDKRLIDTKAELEFKLNEVKSTISGSMWGFTVASASGTGDGYLASIEVGDNNGFTYIPSGVGWWDQTTLDARGFLGGQSVIVDRRFEFSDPDTINTSIFKAPGLTHINIYVEAMYTGNRGGPFGTNGSVTVDLGVAVETGISNYVVAESYATVKTIPLGVLPSDIVIERYVASIPTNQLGLTDNTMFDVVPRIRITNSNYVDGGTGDDPEPTIRFDHIRIVTSSYSIAGQINEEDGASSPLASTVGEVL